MTALKVAGVGQEDGFKPSVPALASSSYRSAALACSSREDWRRERGVLEDGVVTVTAMASRMRSYIVDVGPGGAPKFAMREFIFHALMLVFSSMGTSASSLESALALELALSETRAS